MDLDEDFLRGDGVRHAAQAGGMGMGVDRLVMLYRRRYPRETILFPLLRPSEPISKNSVRVI